MIFTQYYLDCLSQASYLVADEGTRQAVVVDPRRDIAEYLADAEKHDLTIVGVLNTHFHADFVSGHLELAEATGAWIGYGEAAEADFAFRKLVDGERISLGEVTLEIMATPGHTPESISILVYETPTDEVAYGVLTGDALFIGDVGRPDLLASVGVTAEELGAMLYDSVQNRLMGLDDAVRVFPAHGAGSACGKNLSTETQSTIGEQRRTNYACAPMTQEQFVAVVTAGQPAAPEYFLYNATLNKQGRELAPEERLPALTGEEVDAALADGAVIVDARDVQAFAAGHVVGALNVPVDGRMAETVGMVIDPDQKVVLLTEPGAEQEAGVRLVRIGFDGAVGYVADPTAYMLERQDRVQRASRLEPTAVPGLDLSGIQFLDIRNPGELENGTIPGTVNLPLAELRRRLDELDPGAPVLLHCAGGWRSSVGASLLRAHGFRDVSDILGGYAGYEAAVARI